MVGRCNLVDFKEDVDTREATIHRISLGPLDGPQMPVNSGWMTSTITKHNVGDNVSGKHSKAATQYRRSEQIGPSASNMVSFNEKLGQNDQCGGEAKSCPPKPFHRPALPQLTIPQLEKAPSLSTLPPQDTSWMAWRVLFAATVVSSFPIGACLSFGVFRDYYTENTESALRNESTWIGVLNSGLPFMAAPLMTFLCQNVPLPRVHYVWAGWLICVIAIIGAAFCRSIPALIVTQGLLLGIGVTIYDNPLLIIINTWFWHKRGLAYGISFACCDIMGVAWSFLASYLLQHHGTQVTFFTFAAIIFSCSGPCILLLKERGATQVFRRGSIVSQRRTPREDVPITTIGGNFDLIRRDTPRTQQRYFNRPIFYVLLISNLAQALAFYLPLIYLPSYATDLGYSASQGAIVLAIINLAQIVGEVGFGKLSDTVNVHALVIISSTAAALSTFFLWGLAKNFGALVAYAFMFGMSGAGYIALWARMGILFGERDAQMVYSFLCTGRGIGTIVSGPISTWLLKPVVLKSMYGIGKYELLVIFVGASMAVSAGLGLLGALLALGNVKSRLRWTISAPKSFTVVEE